MQNTNQLTVELVSFRCLVISDLALLYVCPSISL